MATADEEDATCPFCGEAVLHMQRHGRRTHIGMCRARELQRQDDMDASSASEAAEEDEEEEHHDVAGDAHGDDHVAPMHADDEPEEDAQSNTSAAHNPLLTHPFGTNGNWEFVQVLAFEESVPRHVLDQLLRILGEGDVTYRTCRDAFLEIDGLEGENFTKGTLLLPPLPDVTYVPVHGPRVEYNVFWKSIADVVRNTIATQGHLMLDPERCDAEVKLGHWTQAFAYQDLLRLLQEMLPDERPLLVPLIFHSGASALMRKCASVSITCVLYNCTHFAPTFPSHQQN